MKPHYGKHDRTHRIAYVANNRWQLQRFSGGKGVNATHGSPHFDPWIDVGSSASLDIALGQLAARDDIGGKDFHEVAA